MENRLTDLEIRITHQEATIDELTGTVMAQQRQIEGLQKQMAFVCDRLRDTEEQLGHPDNDGPEPPPPHY